MVDCRTMLSALVAAYDQHRKWMMADKFVALQRAVDHARDVLNEPAAIEFWHVPRALSDEALRLLTSLPMEEIERRLRMPMAADVEVVELPPRPPLMEPPAHLALERYGITWDGSPDKPLLTRMADGYWTPWHVAADLLERQAAAAPVARLPEDAQVIEPANHTILVPVPAPVPVSERLPGPEDCVPHPRTKRGNWCWGFERCEVPLTRPALWMLMCMEVVEMKASHWLPAHALPLPTLKEATP